MFLLYEAKKKLSIQILTKRLTEEKQRGCRVVEEHGI